MEFDLVNPFRREDASIADLFSEEAGYMSSSNNVDPSSRQNAVSSIFQGRFDDCSFDPFFSYIAINYIDRFLSKQQIPSGKPWILRLVIIACFSLASKMMEIDFSFVDFQEEGEGAFIFEAQTIHRMEALVLSTLEWRMRSITPLCFVDYFISFFMPDQPHFIHDLKNRALKLLIQAQNEMRFLEFKPSLIAASSLLCAADELFPIQLPSFKSAIFSSNYVNNEELLECLSVMSDLAIADCSSKLEVVSRSDSPDTVLRKAQHQWMSESDLTVGSSSNDLDVKRRRAF